MIFFRQIDREIKKTEFQICPGGTRENSPAIDCRECWQAMTGVPAGTAERPVIIAAQPSRWDWKQ